MFSLMTRLVAAAALFTVLCRGQVLDWTACGPQNDGGYGIKRLACGFQGDAGFGIKAGSGPRPEEFGEWRRSAGPENDGGYGNKV